MKNQSQQFTLNELCTLVDLPKRTIRFYMQHGLVSRPEGSGRGAHYDKTHLDQLLTVKKWKQAGLSLQRIQELMEGGTSIVPSAPIRPGQLEVWSHIHLADGLEIHIEPKRAALTPEQVRILTREILAAWERLQQEEDKE
jgi:DNA-binding transcriptional MerR regulator